MWYGLFVETYAFGMTQCLVNANSFVSLLGKYMGVSVQAPPEHLMAFISCNMQGIGGLTCLLVFLYSSLVFLPVTISDVRLLPMYVLYVASLDLKEPLPAYNTQLQLALGRQCD